jgi:DNA-directed RNA polymerase subunit RPC12/RpoP
MRARSIRALGGGERSDIKKSLYTHWACFDCRKSFHNLPLESKAKRKCPECGKTMWDMGVYFEPPRHQARKSWAIAQLLAESGYQFQTEGSVAYIKTFILGASPRIEDVRRNIALAKSQLKRPERRLS